jgi:hypothetical protein
MCFSASASFVSAAVLATTGVALLSRLKNKKYLALALIPLFFGMQQFAEGLVWKQVAPQIATVIYLFFAFVFWPIYIPLSFWIAERTKPLLVLIFLGAIVGAYLLSGIASTHAQLVDHSIQYGKTEKSVFIPFLLYLFVVTAPFFLSKISKMPILGILVGISGLFIAYAYTTWFVSLWCFFAAIFSFGLIFVLPLKK